MKARLLVALAGLPAFAFVSSATTNEWFELNPGDWSVDAATRQWTHQGGGADSFQEVDTNAVPMSSQRNSVSGGRLSVSTDGGFLVYRPGMASTNDANAVVVVDFTAKFRVASRLDVAGLDRMPEGGAQGGLSMRRQADGTVVFAGLDFADGAYAWRDLSGLESVDASKSYHVRLVRTYGGDGGAKVAYFAEENGALVQLSAGGASEFAIPSAGNFLSAVGFRGVGEVAGVKAVMTVRVEGIGVIVIPPEGGAGEPKVYPTLDAAIADQGYGASVTVQRTLADGETVTLAPGVAVTFAAGQQIGEGHLVVRGPSGVDYYDVVNADGTCSLVLNEKARPEIAAEEGREAIAIGADGVTLGLGAASVKPGLFYGVKAAGEPTGVAGATPTGWVQAGADGKLKGELKAGKFGGAGFYGVTVTDDPRVVGGGK